MCAGEFSIGKGIAKSMRFYDLLQSGTCLRATNDPEIHSTYAYPAHTEIPVLKK